jgi:hypothetical protein
MRGRFSLKGLVEKSYFRTHAKSVLARGLSERFRSCRYGGRRSTKTEQPLDKEGNNLSLEGLFLESAGKKQSSAVHKVDCRPDSSGLVGYAKDFRGSPLDPESRLLICFIQ